MKFRIEFLEQVPQLMTIHLDCEFQEQEFGEFSWPPNENMPKLIQSLLKINGIFRIKCYDRHFLDIKKSLAVTWDDILTKTMEGLLLSTDPANIAEEIAVPITRRIDESGFFQLLPNDERPELRTFSLAKRKNLNDPNKK